MVDPSNQAVILEAADHTIDRNTGRVLHSRDTADVQTTFAYDAMGRLIREERDGAWAVYTYSLPSATGSSNPSLNIRDCPQNQTSCTTGFLTRRQAIYDGLGRMRIERLNIPVGGSSQQAQRDFHYDALDRRISESRWGDSGMLTQFTYDRFGRLLQTDHPNGNPARSVIRYRGEQRIDRSTSVATGAAGAENYVCSREEYDALGRLIRVNQDRGSSPSGECQNNDVAGNITTYEYDEADNLTGVNSPGKPAYSTGTTGAFSPPRPTPSSARVATAPPATPMTPPVTCSLGSLPAHRTFEPSSPTTRPTA